MLKSCYIGVAGLALAASGAAAGEIYNISLQGMDFVYNGQANTDIDLTINVGDTVLWTWVSGFHNVASGLPGDPDAGDLFLSGDPTGAVGTTFEYTFAATGVVNYHCQIHGIMGMTSSVTVVPGAPALGLLAPAGLIALRRRR